MAFQKNTPARYVKGVAEMSLFDIGTGDLLYWTNKIQSGNIATSANEGAIEGGLNNQALTYIPDTVRVTGTFEAADFSLVARGLAMGTEVSYNGTVPVMEEVTAESTTLTVKGTPVAAYGEPSSNPTYSCYVGQDGVNYQINPTTKQVVNFTATAGQKYCVTYFTEMASAEELVIPTAWAPTTVRATIKIPVFGENGGNASRSNKLGYLYEFIPRLQLIGGDAGVGGSQTEASTTSVQFTALSYDEADVTCSECADDNSVYGYMVFMPCGSATQAVEALAIIGGGVSVAEEETKQIPVYYVMPNGELVTPDYSALTYQSQATGTASVDTKGVVTGKAAGSTTINVSITNKPSVTAICPVTVTGA